MFAQAVKSSTSDPLVLSCLGMVQRRLGEDHAAAVAAFGKACSLPGALQGAIHALLTAGDTRAHFPNRNTEKI